MPRTAATGTTGATGNTVHPQFPGKKPGNTAHKPAFQSPTRGGVHPKDAAKSNFGAHVADGSSRKTLVRGKSVGSADSTVGERFKKYGTNLHKELFKSLRTNCDTFYISNTMASGNRNLLQALESECIEFMNFCLPDRVAASAKGKANFEGKMTRDEIWSRLEHDDFSLVNVAENAAIDKFIAEAGFRRGMILTRVNIENSYKAACKEFFKMVKEGVIELYTNPTKTRNSSPDSVVTDTDIEWIGETELKYDPTFENAEIDELSSFNQMATLGKKSAMAPWKQESKEISELKLLITDVTRLLKQEDVPVATLTSTVDRLPGIGSRIAKLDADFKSKNDKKNATKTFSKTSYLRQLENFSFGRIYTRRMGPDNLPGTQLRKKEESASHIVTKNVEILQKAFAALRIQADALCVDYMKLLNQLEPVASRICQLVENQDSGVEKAEEELGAWTRFPDWIRSYNLRHGSLNRSIIGTDSRSPNETIVLSMLKALVVCAKLEKEYGKMDANLEMTEVEKVHQMFVIVEEVSSAFSDAGFTRALHEPISKIDAWGNELYTKYEEMFGKWAARAHTLKAEVREVTTAVVRDDMKRDRVKIHNLLAEKKFGEVVALTNKWIDTMENESATNGSDDGEEICEFKGYIAEAHGEALRGEIEEGAKALLALGKKVTPDDLENVQRIVKRAESAQALYPTDSKMDQIAAGLENLRHVGQMSHIVAGLSRLQDRALKRSDDEASDNQELKAQKNRELANELRAMAAALDASTNP